MLTNQSYPFSLVEKSLLALSKQRLTAGTRSRPIKLTGDLCLETFLESYTWLADKYPILNLKYEWDRESGAHVKVLDGPAAINFQDYSAKDDAFVSQKLIDLSRANFDAHKDHLVMMHVIKCDADTFMLYVKSHHIFSDGLTCLKILQNTLEAYHARKTTGSFANTIADYSPSHYVRFEQDSTTTHEHLN